MPAKSKAQQKAAGAALAAKRGETPVSQLKGASRKGPLGMCKTALQRLAHPQISLQVAAHAGRPPRSAINASYSASVLGP
jgi:hypothetical protein